MANKPWGDKMDRIIREMASSTGKTYPGQIEPGNIDIVNRPRVPRQSGATSTLATIVVGFDDGHVVLPTVSDDGRMMTEQEAIETYRKTGKHLGKFSDLQQAVSASELLHKQQESMFSKLPTGLASKAESFLAKPPNGD